MYGVMVFSVVDGALTGWVNAAWNYGTTDVLSQACEAARNAILSGSVSHATIQLDQQCYSEYRSDQINEGLMWGALVGIVTVCFLRSFPVDRQRE